MSSTADQSGYDRYEFGPFRIDAQREIVLRDGELVPLTPKTFQILLVLVRNNQELVTKDELMKAASGAVLKAIRDFNATHPRDDGDKKSSGPKIREGL